MICSRYSKVLKVVWCRCFWISKLSFVVDILAFLTWRLFGLFFETFGNFFLIFWSPWLRGLIKADGSASKFRGNYLNKDRECFIESNIDNWSKLLSDFRWQRKKSFMTIPTDWTIRCREVWRKTRRRFQKICRRFRRRENWWRSYKTFCVADGINE